MLTHDDLSEDRKIAFILYLAPWDIPCENGEKHDETDQINYINAEKGEVFFSTMIIQRLDHILINIFLQKGWSKAMGGELQFFASKEGQPSSVVKALVPRNNTFAFFKVNNVSFHQVQKIHVFFSFS